MTLRILYRGPLSSCNYGCEYCPFAKHDETHAQLQGDRDALRRFSDWCAGQTRRLGILFTPWGEALVRRWYPEAMTRLSHLPHVRRVAIQTNLSAGLDWVRECDRGTLAFWATYHPGEVSRGRFLRQCHWLYEQGVRFSVGVVGLREHLGEIQSLRAELPREVYLWVNAYKRQPDYYAPAEEDLLQAIDPLFAFNNTYHASRGEACDTGSRVISVDGDGRIRRCHFVSEVRGNLYDADWERHLREEPCPNATCGCHIGHVHLQKLGLSRIFGDGVLERIPAGPEARQA